MSNSLDDLKYSADHIDVGNEDNDEGDVGYADSPEEERPAAYLMRPLRVNSGAGLLSPENDDEDLSTFNTNPPHLLIGAKLQKQLSKPFDANKQLRRLLWDGLLLWLRTLLFLGFLGFTLWNNGRRAVMGNADKAMFNTFMTGLSIALGLNIAASLNSMSLNLRWWFLSRKKRSLSEVDAILKSDISNPSSYLLSPKPWAAGVTLSWLLINIGSQIGVAMIGLTYSVDMTVEAALLVPNSDVGVSNLTAYFAASSTTAPTRDAAEYTANFYGSMAPLFVPAANISMAPQPYSTCGATIGYVWYDVMSCLYFFINSSPDLVAGVSQTSVFSDRSVNVSSSCIAQPVVLPSGNGSFNYIDLNIPVENGSFPQVFVPSVEPGETTYFTGPIDCGPRCRQIVAFEPSLSSPWLYTCNISVSEVWNSTLPEHNLSDPMAKMSAAAITFGGSSNSTSNDSATTYHRYPAQSIFGQPFEGFADDIGRAIAIFATGAIAMMDLNNPKILSKGVQPQPGYKVNIPNLSYLYIIFSLSGGLQFLLFIITAFMANRVVVTDDSPIAIARLLRPIVNRLGPSGTIATGTEIGKALTADDNMKVIYSVTRYDLRGKRNRLDLADEDGERAFPNGTYD